MELPPRAHNLLESPSLVSRDRVVRMLASALRLSSLAVVVTAYTLPTPLRTQGCTGAVSSPQSRREFLAGAAALGGWAAGAGAAVAADLPGGISYSVVKEGKNGGKPKVGDLIAIRFKVALQSSGQVIDDILSSSEPYYYRVGRCVASMILNVAPAAPDVDAPSTGLASSRRQWTPPLIHAAPCARAAAKCSPRSRQQWSR